MAGRRVLVLRELAFEREAVTEIAAAPTLDDRFRESLARNGLLHRIHRQDVRHADVVVRSAAGVGEVARDAALGVARKIEVEIHRHAELEIAEIDAGLAPALHGHHEDHAPRPLRSGRVATRTAEARAETARGEIGLAAAPQAGEAADVFRRHAG